MSTQIETPQPTTTRKRPDGDRTRDAKAATLARRHARQLKRGFTPTRAGHRRIED